VHYISSESELTDVVVFDKSSVIFKELSILSLKNPMVESKQFILLL